MTSNNRLPVLAGEVANLHGQVEQHSREAARKALQIGGMLTEAKSLVDHGGWADWLESAGIGDRMAQRYMRLHRFALNSDTVSDLGGIGAALKWLSPLRLPKKGEILIASADDFAPGGDDLMGFVWPHGRGYHVAMLDLRPEWPHMKKTNKAIRLIPEVGEAPVWLTLWLSCDWRCADLSFCLTRGDAHIKDMVSMVSTFDSPAADSPRWHPTAWEADA